MCRCTAQPDFVHLEDYQAFSEMDMVERDVTAWRELRRCPECSQLWLMEVQSAMDRTPSRICKVTTAENWCEFEFPTS